MLVVSRRSGESVLVGDRIVITVLRVADRRVRLGIEAPREIPVLRAESPPRVDAAAWQSPGVHQEDGATSVVEVEIAV